MFIEDAKEGAPLVVQVLRHLLEVSPTRGREGSDLRTACGDVMANAESLLQNDAIGEPLDNCFELARKTGISFKQMDDVRETAAEIETPVTIGAMLVKNCMIDFCLAAQSRILADTKFSSRQDIDAYKTIVNDSFNAMEEITADEMDQMTYRALVELHAATTYFLVERARPLPRMLNYRFAEILSSLAIAYKLYDDAGRADELREENKIVHPAFMQLRGKALSS
jgi:prophage DNA circulation protein